VAARWLPLRGAARAAEFFGDDRGARDLRRCLRAPDGASAAPSVAIDFAPFAAAAALLSKVMGRRAPARDPRFHRAAPGCLIR